MVTSFDKTSCQLSGDVLCRRLELKLWFSFLFIYSRETRFQYADFPVALWIRIIFQTIFKFTLFSLHVLSLSKIRPKSFKTNLRSKHSASRLLVARKLGREQKVDGDGGGGVRPECVSKVLTLATQIDIKFRANIGQAIRTLYLTQMFPWCPFNNLLLVPLPHTLSRLVPHTTFPAVSRMLSLSNSRTVN